MHSLNRFFVAAALLAATGIASAQPQPPAVLWTKSYTHIGRTGPVSFGDAKALRDGSFIITGWVSDIRWQLNLWLCYVDSAGNTIWDRSIALRDSLREREHNEEGESIVVTANNDLAVVGTTNTNEESQPDIFFVLADTAGNVLVKHSYGSSDRREEGVDICQTEGGFGILALDINPGMGKDGNYLLLRIDDNGDSLWSRTYGEEGKAYHPGRILALNNGGFMISGFATYGYNHEESEALVIRTDENGEVVWQQGYGIDGVSGFIQSGEDEFAGLAWSNTQNGPDGWWDVQLNWIDGDGEILGEGERIPVPPYPAISRPFLSLDQGYIVASNNCWILRTDADGSELYQKVYGDTAEGRGSSAYTICTTSDSGFVMGGFGPRIEGYGRPPILMRLGPEVWPDVVRESDAAPQVFMLYPAYPNPFNSRTVIQYSLPQERNVALYLYNLQGQLVQTLFRGFQSAGSYTVSLDGATVPSGIYFVVLHAGDSALAKKLEVLR